MTAALADRTNAYLTAFDTHPFKAYQLRDAVTVKTAAQQAAESQLSQSTRGVEPQPDGYTVDPEDKQRAEHELKAFKDVVSTLKFAYLESNIKLQFVNHIMQADGPQVVPKQELDQLEEQRLASKKELQGRKRRAAELESSIRAEAERAGERLAQRAEQAERARKLLAELDAFESELALLRNKRPAAERVTVEEAYALLDDQDQQISSHGPRMAALEASIKEEKAQLRATKVAMDRTQASKKDMKREMADRDAKGNRNERAEEGCRWITNATALYSSLLGIRNAYAVGSPPTQMVVEYDSLSGATEQGDVRTLSVELGPGGEMVNAKLVNSSESIEDLVEACLPSQDMRGLVQLVRARIGR